ncbi:MAG: aspartate/tyrosine/aromatic aminotransferase [Hyphomonadaceae bacterium]|nr:aspartate/tyrosine/aromatic aminotransferase [Hyphomonadaceae bacterium]
MLEKLQPQPIDPILSLVDIVRADARAEKVDLGVGVYIDESGRTPIMAAVKAAERELLETQESKVYLGSFGDVRSTELIVQLVLGEGLCRTLGGRVRGLQAAGGVAALRLGAELIARAGAPPIVLGRPTWAIHDTIMMAGGAQVRWVEYFDPRRQAVDFDATVDALKSAPSGTPFLVHASCHNPTGADSSPAQWRELAGIVSARGLVPFVDAAYLGLGDGIDADAAGLRLMLEAAPDALVAVSGSKSFGLYRERVGALFILGRTAEVTNVAMTNATAIARTLYSVPPDHGAAIVRLVLEREDLRASWLRELDAMRLRLNAIRADFAARAERAGLPLAPVRDHRGMFSLLPLTPEQVRALRADRAIYMPESGRVNLAALHPERAQYVVDALAAAMGGGR